jgi:DNA-binding CsgD family transcriptional regulator
MTTLYAAGELALWQGDIRAGRGLHERQLALAEEAGDVVQAARARTSLGAAAALTGDYGRGRQLVSQALTALGPAGDPRLRALALRNLGWVLRLDGDLRAADAALEQAAVLFHDLGDTNNEAVVAISQAEVARDRDDPRPVTGLLLQALALAVEGGDRRSLAYAAEVTATLPAVRPRPVQLVRLLGAVAAQYQSVGMPLDPRRRAALERLRGAARAQVSEEVFAQAWRDGSRLTPTELADTIQRLLSGGEPPLEAPPEPSPVQGPSLLTERERAVLQRVAAGKPTKHIARSLGIAERTVKSHLSSAFAKLGASSRGHAALLAVQQGLLDPPSESAAAYSRSASA